MNFFLTENQKTYLLLFVGYLGYSNDMNINQRELFVLSRTNRKHPDVR